MIEQIARSSITCSLVHPAVIYQENSLFYCAFALLGFTDTQILCFWKTERLWQPWIKQVYWHCFPHGIWSVPHFGNAHSISSFFIVILFVMVICGHWSLLLLLSLFGVGPNCSHIRQWTKWLKCICLDCSTARLIPYLSPSPRASHSETQHYWC